MCVCVLGEVTDWLVIRPSVKGRWPESIAPFITTNSVVGWPALGFFFSLLLLSLLVRTILVIRCLRPIGQP